MLDKKYLQGKPDCYKNQNYIKKSTNKLKYVHGVKHSPNFYHLIEIRKNNL